MNAGPLVDTEDNVETHSDTVQNDVGADMKEDIYVLEVGNALDTGAKPLYFLRLRPDCNPEAAGRWH